MHSEWNDSNAVPSRIVQKSALREVEGRVCMSIAHVRIFIANQRAPMAICQLISYQARGSCL